VSNIYTYQKESKEPDYEVGYALTVNKKHRDNNNNDNQRSEKEDNN